MPKLYLAAYTAPLTERTGYRWLWQHQRIPAHLLGEFYSKIKKPTDVARWPVTEFRGGLVVVDSEWAVVYRFLNAGRDALGRQGRFFLIAGFLRLNEISQLDLHKTLESKFFSTPLDSPPQQMELDLPSCTTRCPDDLLTKLSTTSTVEAIGAKSVNQLAAACTTLPPGGDFSLRVDGDTTRLVCRLSVTPSVGRESAPGIGGFEDVPHKHRIAADYLRPIWSKMTNQVGQTLKFVNEKLWPKLFHLPHPSSTNWRSPVLRRPWRWVIGGLVVGFILGFILGYSKIHEQRQRNEQKQQQIENLQRQNVELHQQIEELQQQILILDARIKKLENERQRRSTFTEP